MPIQLLSLTVQPWLNEKKSWESNATQKHLKRIVAKSKRLFCTSRYNYENAE